MRLKIGHTPKIPQVIIISSRETGDENPSKNQDCLVSHFFRYQTQSPYCCLHIPFNPTIYIYRYRCVLINKQIKIYHRYTYIYIDMCVLFMYVYIYVYPLHQLNHFFMLYIYCTRSQPQPSTPGQVPKVIHRPRTSSRLTLGLGVQNG